MTNAFSIDWKYILMFVVTIAGVFSPIWLTRFQSPDKQIVVHQISQSSLQPTSSAIPDLKLTLNGAPLSAPFLSAFEIQNIGEKPILSKDFEAPLELIFGNNLKVIRAEITDKSPSDIAANVSWGKNTVRLDPTLLNPQDKITLSILTTGGTPEIQTNTRIAGVNTVPVIKAQESKPNPRLSILLIIGTFLCSIPSLAIYRRWKPFTQNDATLKLKPRTALAASFILMFCSIGMLTTVFSLYGMDSFWTMLLMVYAVQILSVPFARMFEP